MTRVAVVTGASRGLGAAVAMELARRSLSVVLAARSQAGLDEVVGRIRASGGSAVGVAADVSRLDDVEAVRAAALEAFGPVEVLVSNAAVLDPLGPVWEAAPDDAARIVGVNVLGAWNCLRVFMAPMVAAGWGRVVGVSSLAAAWEVPTTALYAATKAAFERLHLVAAADAAGTGVAVNVIRPGANDTEMQARLRSDDFALSDIARDAAAAGLLRKPEVTAVAVADLCADDRTGLLVDLDAISTAAGAVDIAEGTTDVGGHLT